MKYNTITILGFLLALCTSVKAQNQQDSIVQKVIQQASLNFPAMRTFMVSYEKKTADHYSLKSGEREKGGGEINHLNALRMSATMPIVRNRHFSLYANAKANFLISDAEGLTPQSEAKVFNQSTTYSYYQAGLSASYRMQLWGRPFMLNAIVMGDGSNDYWGKMQCIFSVTTPLVQTPTTQLSVGLSAMTLFNKVPAFVTFNYWHKFDNKWNVDVFLPSHAYLRYRSSMKHRLSAGASILTDAYYIKSDDPELPKHTYYNKVMVNPELMYEYILSKHFFITAKAGTNLYIMNGLYKTNRKGNDGDPLIKVTHPTSLFFNTGFSYNM